MYVLEATWISKFAINLFDNMISLAVIKISKKKQLYKLIPRDNFGLYNMSHVQYLKIKCINKSYSADQTNRYNNYECVKLD